MKKRVIKISEIKPFGNLKELLEKFEVRISQIEKDGYSKEVSRVLKLVVEFGFTDAKEWLEEFEGVKADPLKRDENEMIVLLGRIFVIRLNNIAMKHLNNIDMEPIHKQLQDSVDLKKYFPNVQFEK